MNYFAPNSFEVRAESSHVFRRHSGPYLTFHFHCGQRFHSLLVEIEVDGVTISEVNVGIGNSDIFLAPQMAFPHLDVGDLATVRVQNQLVQLADLAVSRLHFHPGIDREFPYRNLAVRDTVVGGVIVGVL